MVRRFLNRIPIGAETPPELMHWHGREAFLFSRRAGMGKPALQNNIRSSGILADPRREAEGAMPENVEGL